MNTFSPVISQSSPSRVALAVRLPASEPVPGSVSPKQASVSPEAMPGSHSFFWSSVPYPAIDLPTRPRLTLTMPRTAESPRPSSSISRQYDRESTGVPPSSSGRVSPRKPSSPRRPTISRSTCSSRSQRARLGTTSASTKSAAVDRSSSCSSVSASVMPGPYVTPRAGREPGASAR